jgi:hypothetical protein
MAGCVETSDISWYRDQETMIERFNMTGSLQFMGCSGVIVCSRPLLCLRADT